MDLIKEEDLNLYDNLDKCIENLKKLNLTKAKEYIVLAMNDDINSGKVQELLGIYYELKGNLKLATRHYRAAIALEPDLISADKNLKRVCEYKYICSNAYISYGFK